MRIPVRSIKPQSQTGSILVVVLAVLVIAGLFITFGIDSMKLDTPADKRLRTQEDMKFIATQLASFAQRGNYLPCPAIPETLITADAYGWSSWTGTTCARFEGVLPVRDLGIAEDFMKDAWGHYYTYRMSRAVSQDNVFDGAGDASIYASCRTDAWVRDQAGLYNMNPTKARFCCAGGTNALNTFASVKDVSGANYVRSSAPFYNAWNVPVGPTAPAVPSEYVAYVLVSHGENNGAFIDSSAIHGTTGLAGDELENANGDVNYAKSYISLEPGANRFDDLVTYKTQYQVMADLGSGSCYEAYYGSAAAALTGAYGGGTTPTVIPGGGNGPAPIYTACHTGNSPSACECDNHNFSIAGTTGNDNRLSPFGACGSDPNPHVTISWNGNDGSGSCACGCQYGPYSVAGTCQ